MPLDGSGHSMARIPPVWRLQSYIEGLADSPDVHQTVRELYKGPDRGFFYRANVARDMSISTLRQAVAAHDRIARVWDAIPEHSSSGAQQCVHVIVGGADAAFDSTVESAALFERNLSGEFAISVDWACVVASAR